MCGICSSNIHCKVQVRQSLLKFYISQATFLRNAQTWTFEPSGANSVKWYHFNESIALHRKYAGYLDKANTTDLITLPHVTRGSSIHLQQYQQCWIIHLCCIFYLIDIGDCEVSRRMCNIDK